MKVVSLLRVLLLALLSLLLFAACTGSGDSGEETTSDATAQPTESNVEPAQPSDPAGVLVPDLTDTPFLEAFELLRAADLRPAISDTYSLGAIWQPEASTSMPEPGQRVESGSVVTLEPGPAPLRFPDDLPDDNDTVKMPDLVGINLREAVEQLEALDVIWLVRQIPALPPSEADHLFDEYRVIRQMPDPGAELIVGLGLAEPDTVLLFPELAGDS